MLVSLVSCKKKMVSEVVQPPVPINTLEVAFDSTKISIFFQKYPKLKLYQKELESLYRKHDFRYIWFDKDGLNEFSGILYNKVSNLSTEGIKSDFPYKAKFDTIYNNPEKNKKASTDTELLSSSLYFFYTSKVFEGIDSKKVTDLEWFLPRKKQTYLHYLDSLLIDPSLINKEEKGVLKQYYLLRNVMQRYQSIEKKGSWNPIEIDPAIKSYKPGDSAKAISQIRKYLFLTDAITADSKSNVYDSDLEAGILNFKKASGNTINNLILPQHIKYMNVPITERIQTIMVNMERCRWISNDITKSKELIVVNIPAFELTFFRNGIPELKSKVVVGKTVNKTVIY